MFEELFTDGSTIERYRTAPLLDERLCWLEHCAESGARPNTLRRIASCQFHLARLLDLQAGDRVDITRIEAAAGRWVRRGGVLATGGRVAAGVWGRGTPHVEAAVAAMTRGRYARQFWIGGVVMGLAAPAVLVAVSLAADTGSWPAAVAGVSAVAGMWCYEDSFVRAGQSVPLS